MAEVPIIVAESKTVYLDVCTGCHFVWFDTQEFEETPKLPARLAADETLPVEAKEALAAARLEILQQESAFTEVVAPPDHWWQFALAMMGMPIEYNDTPLRNRPIVTWSLAVLIAIVSLSVMTNLKTTVEDWGLIPAEFGRHFGLTFFTSFFLHAGFLHLIGNLYFLLVFGDNTEDVLGRFRFLLLVAISAFVGDITHIALDPHAAVPCIGASGGISGILAYYCLRFPAATIGGMWRFRWFRVPVRFMLAFWLLMQCIEALWITGGFGGVAVFAHLGGAAVGVVFWWWTWRSASAGMPQQERSSG